MAPSSSDCCHMTVTWLILFSHMTFMWSHTTSIPSHMVSIVQLFWKSAVESRSCLCPRLLDTGPSPLIAISPEPSDGPHLLLHSAQPLLPLWICYTSIIVLSLNSEKTLFDSFQVYSVPPVRIACVGSCLVVLTVRNRGFPFMRSTLTRSIFHEINSIFYVEKSLLWTLNKMFGSSCDLVELKLISIKPARLHTSNLKESKE